MIQTAFVSLFTASLLTFSAIPFASGVLVPEAQIRQAQIGSRTMSLNNRYGYELPDNVYKDNILLNLAYISGRVKSKNDINWDELHKPFGFQFSLEPGQRFAYHDLIDQKYQDNVVLAPHTNFGAGDGYKYADGLYGMGVCHLASLINWAAKDAGLESIAPTNHDFYSIPEIPKEYGVAIYNSPDAVEASKQQNLYIKNTLDSKVTFRFEFDGANLHITISKY